MLEPFGVPSFRPTCPNPLACHEPTLCATSPRPYGGRRAEGRWRVLGAGRRPRRPPPRDLPPLARPLPRGVAAAVSRGRAAARRRRRRRGRVGTAGAAPLQG